ncbi:geranylgeranylglyceryl/heptaprenylglyceryl phosphate synthase [Candidatus Micrarchaeota archaeon]|nr:geranylgeranylglyceryl/heptaprenylglyceryl phosphate synthase [Candidatus Micrarchaeota archaeon]
MSVKIGKVEKLALKKIEEEGVVFSVLIDPSDKEKEKEYAKLGVAAGEAGADLVMLGGSTGAQGELLDSVASQIKDKTDVPLLLFPGNIATLSKHADAVLFMRLLNSRNVYWHSTAQMLGAPIVKQMKLEAIPTGYIVVEPGGTVGWVGDVNLVLRDKPKTAAALALGGEYSGCRVIYLEAGSGSKLGPIPSEMIAATKSVLSVPLIVGGGIRSAEQASLVVKAGADWVNVGTVFENSENAKEKISELAKAVKEEGRKKSK